MSERSERAVGLRNGHADAERSEVAVSERSERAIKLRNGHADAERSEVAA
ncbi:hypothetical protein [Polymorphospora rubra]|nr:hypothetical protein [Polymorphospora rubra]